MIYAPRGDMTVTNLRDSIIAALREGYRNPNITFGEDADAVLDVLMGDDTDLHLHRAENGTVTAVPMRVHESIVQAAWSNGRLRCNHGSSDHCTVTHTHEEPWTWVDAPGEPAEPTPCAYCNDTGMPLVETNPGQFRRWRNGYCSECGKASNFYDNPGAAAEEGNHP